MAEAKENTVSEEPQVLTMTEKVDDVDVSKQYLVDDMTDEGRVIYNKLAIVQKSKNEILANISNLSIELFNKQKIEKVSANIKYLQNRIEIINTDQKNNLILFNYLHDKKANNSTGNPT